MQSTMQDFPLTIAAILRYAVSVHGDRTVTTATGAGGYRHATYAEVGGQAARLANALRRLGITVDERVATFTWIGDDPKVLLLYELSVVLAPLVVSALE